MESVCDDYGNDDDDDDDDDDNDDDGDDDGGIIVNRSQIRGAGAYSAFLLCRRSQKRKETVDRVQKDLEEKKKGNPNLIKKMRWSSSKKMERKK